MLVQKKVAIYSAVRKDSETWFGVCVCVHLFKHLYEDQ